MKVAQRWEPKAYAQNARFVTDLGSPVLDLLDPQPGERILDLGCGDGALTLKLVLHGCQVMGIDSSPEFIEAAQALGLDARLGDARALDFEFVFNAVFSNAVLHWVKAGDADRMMAGVWRSLRSSGRFVAELGGEGNTRAIRQALHSALRRRGIDPLPVDPWYFPSVDEYTARLQDNGFRVQQMHLIPRPTVLPGSMAAWLETFGGAFTGALKPADRAAFIEEVQAALKPRLFDERSGCWTADYVRLRFVAIKP